MVVMGVVPNYMPGLRYVNCDVRADFPDSYKACTVLLVTDQPRLILARGGIKKSFALSWEIDCFA